MPETLTEFQQFLANVLETDSVTRTDLFRHEVEGYGIESVQDFTDSYYGCYPDVQTFVEDFVNECYSDVINKLPTWLQTAIDYELIWYQSLRHDFFEVSFDGEVYIFNRHW
jgi:antirestriction protein|tara:strand:- start:515 stop:847 length:333 start_codon:yes stop_codon:yes gene_type:complete